MSEPMSNEQLDAIRQRVANATPGEWGFYDGELRQMDGDRPVGTVLRWADPLGGDDPDWEFCMYADNEVDAAFIAHARQDVPALLNEVERLRAENERLEAERQQERNYSAGLLAMQDELYHAAVDLRWKYDDLGRALDNAHEGDDTMDRAISDVITALDRTETLDEEDIAEAHMLEVSRLKSELAAVREFAARAACYIDGEPGVEYEVAAHFVQTAIDLGALKVEVDDE